MAPTATVTIDRSSDERPIDPAIYGQYLEHVEDCVDPGMIDDDGLREDVIAAARELDVPAVRWPGGCFADTYHWADGVGGQRPIRPNWHWGNGELERNRFGTHEFLDWCERVGARPYINTNLGTGSLIEALRWLDYCTGAADTTDVRARRANGRQDPWHVPYWGIGNETWGHWEAGHTDAAPYAQTLANWADFFHRQAPNTTIVGVGSSEGRDPDWDRAVLDAAGADLGLLSLHVYAATMIGEVEQHRSGLAHFGAYAESRIEAMAGLVRAHNAEHGRDIGIALDEWNIRHWRRGPGGYRLDRADPRTGSDALCAAGFFHAMIRHADVVRMANYVFLVNGNGVLDARGGTCRSTPLSRVFADYRRLMIGQAVPVHVHGAEVETPSMLAGNPEHPVAEDELPASLPAVDAVACRHQSIERLALINRTDQPVEVETADGGWHVAVRHCVHPASDALHQATADTGNVGPTALPPWSITIAERAAG